MNPNFSTFAAFKEVSATATPDAGLVIAYAKTDGFLYTKDDVGTETKVGAATSDPTPLISAIWS